MSAVSGEETQQVLVAPGAARAPLAIPRRLLRMRSDATLAERFAAGDEASFDVIYERHRPVVLAVCMGVLGTPADAEDATQETFSALAVALRTRPPAELRPWLIRVARNASIDTTRRRRHRLLTIDGEIPEVAARPTGPGQAELAVVLDGIRELPEGQRMALLMRELGGHSYAEIADFLSTDEEAVKGLIARARVGLRTYREATELSCATARGTIAAEPDGRRYDKTIRRHLRGCNSCRAYREALRDDARALRAALPIQAGTVATGSLSSGMLTAAKGSLLGYGLTQAATTCAASACAVGAIGGMVFVAPVHKLGLPPILPAVKTAAAPKPAVTVRSGHHHEAAPKHVSIAPAATVAPSSSAATAGERSESVSAPAITHRSAGYQPARRLTVTRVVLPNLPRHHHHPKDAAAPGQAAVVAQSNVSQGNGNQGNGNGNGNQGNGNQGQGNGHGNGHAYGSWKTQTPSAPAQPSQSSTVYQQVGSSSSSQNSTQASSAASSQTSPVTQAAQGNGNHGHGNGRGSAHGGNPHNPTASTASVNAAQTAPPATTVTVASTIPATTSVTTSSSSSSVGNGQGHGHGSGNGHGKANQTAAVQNATSSQQNAPPTITINYGSNGSGGQGHGHNK